MINEYDLDESASILDRLEEMCNMLGLHGMVLGVHVITGCLYNLYEENQALKSRVAELENTRDARDLEVICQIHIPD
jgi:hypothetical protein